MICSDVAGVFSSKHQKSNLPEKQKVRSNFYEFVKIAFFRGLDPHRREVKKIFFGP